MEEMGVIQAKQYGFSKGKFCLTNLVALYVGITESMDKGWGIDIFYLNFSKPFGMVPHNILLSKMERYGFDRWTVRRKGDLGWI